MDVNKYERLQLDPKTQIKVKEQVVLRKDMDEINIRGYPTLNLSYVFITLREPCNNLGLE